MKIRILGFLFSMMLLVLIFSTIGVANNNNNPPNLPEVEGSTSGLIGETYTYGITLTDPDLDDVMLNLKINFGDGIHHYD
jgi:hypothetical protein